MRPATRVPRRWDGQSWRPIGGGIGNGVVHGLESYHVGGDRVALAVVGTFSEVDGHPANSIALWNDCPGLRPPPGPCPGDLSGSGSVGVPDLLELLACWGVVEPGDPCEGADLTNSGAIGILDLLDLLEQWGACPSER